MRKSVAEHFHRRREEFPEQKGSGPDFLKKGRAVEVKGSGFDQKATLEQLTRYIYKYAGVGFALPVDDITSDLLYGLRAIERAASTRALTEKKDIKIHLVGQVGDATFGVQTFDSAKELMKRLDNALEQICYLASSLSPDQAIEKTTFAVNIWDELKRSLAEEVIREYNRVTLPSQQGQEAQTT